MNTSTRNPRPKPHFQGSRNQEPLPGGQRGGSYNPGSGNIGITFQNIKAAAGSVVGQPDVSRGCADNPWSNITFDHVVIAEKTLTNLKDFTHAIEPVTEIAFK